MHLKSSSAADRLIPGFAVQLYTGPEKVTEYNTRFTCIDNMWRGGSYIPYIQGVYMEDMIFIDSVRVIFTDCIGTCSLIKNLMF